MRRHLGFGAAIAALGAATAVLVGGGGTSIAAVGGATAFHPTVSDFQFLSAGTAPPSQAACNAFGRRCFNPTAMANSYDYASLLAAGNEGQGKTIALVD